MFQVSTKRFFRSRVLLPLAAMAVSVLPGSTAEAKRAKKASASACGIDYLPFVEGTEWKYQYSIPPGVEEKENALKTKDPETLTITVKKVEKDGAGANIILEEKYREVAFTTLLSCNSSGLIVPINSFFYVGELPGGLGMQVENAEYDGTMYPGKSGMKKGSSFFVKVKAQIKRPAAGKADAKHLLATLEMERQLTVGKKELVEVSFGAYDAMGVEFALSGRVSLAPTPDKQTFLPDGTATLWFAPGIGILRAYNRMEQGWELTSFTPAAAPSN